MLSTRAKWLIGISIPAVALAGVRLLMPRPQKPATTPQVAVAEVGATFVSDNIVAEGKVVPGAVAYVTPLPTMRDPISQVYVQTGDRVARGAVLADINPITQKAALEKSQAALRSARSQMQQVRTPYRPEQIRQAESRVREGRQRVAEAEAALDLLRNGTDPLEIASASSEIDALQARLDQATKKFESYRQLFDQGAISRLQADQAEADVAVARGALEQARNRLALLRRGPRAEEIRAAQARLDQTRSSLEAEVQAYQLLRAGSRPEQISEARERVQQLQVETGYRSELIRNRELRAPISGVVIARNINPGEIAVGDASRATSVGPVNNATRSLFVIADDASLEFLAQVDQRFLGDVRVGQAADVRIEALPGRVFAGKVVRMSRMIASNGAAPNGLPAALTFPVWVRVPNPQGALAPGQVGLVSIGQRKSGLMVPVSAVVPLALGEGVVYVEKDGRIAARTVRFAAPRGNGDVRILSGLSAGERVVTSNPTKLRDGMQVRTVLAPPPVGGRRPL